MTLEDSLAAIVNGLTSVTQASDDDYVVLYNASGEPTKKIKAIDLVRNALPYYDMALGGI